MKHTLRLRLEQGCVREVLLRVEDIMRTQAPHRRTFLSGASALGCAGSPHVRLVCYQQDKNNKDNDNDTGNSRNNINGKKNDENKNGSTPRSCFFACPS